MTILVKVLKFLQINKVDLKLSAGNRCSFCHKLCRSLSGMPIHASGHFLLMAKLTNGLIITRLSTVPLKEVCKYKTKV